MILFKKQLFDFEVTC